MRNLHTSALLTSLLLVPMAIRAQAAGDDADIQKIKKRIVEDIAPPPNKGKWLITRGRKYAADMQPDGTWKDVNYRSMSSSNWGLLQHLRRMQCMSRAYRVLGRDPALKGKILKAWDHWIAKDYKHPKHDWSNRIGAPLNLYPTLLCLEDELSARQMKAGLDILARGYQNGIWVYGGRPATGQNLIWVASMSFYRGLLRGDPKEVKLHTARIAKEIFIAADGIEGIKADNSFWQHGSILYSGGYGRGFAIDCTRFASFVHGTPFAFPQQKLKLLTGYVLDGCLWMCRGECMDYGTTGREIARKGVDRWGQSVARACGYMAEIPGPRQAEFKAAAEALRGKKTGWKGEPSGNRSFWRSDFMVHRRPDYYFSARMHSKRTTGTETGNGENLKGYYLADGSTFILRRGDEYKAIFPVWNWRRIPGITCPQSTGRFPQVNWGKGAKGSTSFVGAVSDGRYGVAACDFKKAGVEARKAWFGFDRAVVCLGAGIKCSGKDPVATSVNQCLLKKTVTTSAGVKAGGKAHALSGPAWIHHDGVGYVFPRKAKIHLYPGQRTGNWHDINRMYSKDPVSLDVFDLWIDHGKSPNGAGYEYHILPGVEAADVPGHVKQGGVEVLLNTPALQAVRHKRLKLIGAAFYAPGKLEVPGGPVIAVDRSCILLVHLLTGGRYKVALCKPDVYKMKAKSVGVTIAGRKVEFKLLTGEHAGKSMVRDVKP